MTRNLFAMLVLLLSAMGASGQITTPQIKANFGVDADLRSNYFNGALQAGNDDWFQFPATPGSGEFVIDTTGATAIVLQYAIDPNFRKLPFFRTMRYPAYSVVNNRLLIDAIFVRDYHNSDSTVFGSGSNKNGMSPASWSCPASMPVLPKNDILDMYVHVRRQGPNMTDTLWMFGGLSLEGVVGDRYFDFEMYQTDIFYNRATQQFSGYGADSGHTSWKFDAGGNVTTPGDIIFSAEYNSSTLTAIEARIWVDVADTLLTPAAFDWDGNFDGAMVGSKYGYAGIKPKTAAPFYTGMESAANTWAGPFGLIRSNNSYVTDYTANQFMEFSVNLTQLGLDPVTLLGGSSCGLPFRRVLVKTRSATAFTAELKDFVGPYDFSLAPQAQALADVPFFCDTIGVSQLQVTNAVSTSFYQWSTLDGHILGADTGYSVTVDTPGTYIVVQQLQAGCSAYATDTVQLVYDPDCGVLSANPFDLRASVNHQAGLVTWKDPGTKSIRSFHVERSTDGIHFLTIGERVSPGISATYSLTDPLNGLTAPAVYYRLKVIGTNHEIRYTEAIRLPIPRILLSGIRIFPNPATRYARMQISSPDAAEFSMQVYDLTGRRVYYAPGRINAGETTVELDFVRRLPAGSYALVVRLGAETFSERLQLDR